jgi:hypothetical protein
MENSFKRRIFNPTEEELKTWAAINYSGYNFPKELYNAGMFIKG